MDQIDKTRVGVASESDHVARRVSVPSTAQRIRVQRFSRAVPSLFFHKSDQPLLDLTALGPGQIAKHRDACRESSS